MAPFGLIAILARIGTRCYIVQALVRRAGELIFFSIVSKTLGTKLVLANLVCLPMLTGILVEGVVFYIALCVVLFQIGLVLFAAIACVHYDLIW